MTECPVDKRRLKCTLGQLIFMTRGFGKETGFKTHVCKSLGEGFYTDLGPAVTRDRRVPVGRGKGFSSSTPGKDGRSMLALPSSPLFLSV